MGGSLGLALKRRKAGRFLVTASARREETRKLARKLGAADRVFEKPEDAVRGADIVVFCTSVLSIPRLARQCMPHIRGDAVITDVGSTKLRLVKSFGEMTDAFIGSHPIAGSEEKGLAAACASLYDGSVCVITPGKSSRTGLIRRARELWHNVGADTTVMSPEEHDRIIARTSHLPHLVAAALAAHVSAGPAGKTALLCGPGFRDTTRVAAGSADVWHDIVASNTDNLLRELDGYQAVLRRLRTALSKRRFNEVRRFLERARQGRGKLLD